MKTKKLIIPLLLASFICLVVMQSLTPPPPVLQSNPFEMQPPIVKHVWLQKLATPTPRGNNIIMKIEYYPDSRLDSSINIYVDATNTVTFSDNGTAPDDVRRDRIYTAYLTEDLNAFSARVTALEATASTQGGVLHFTGHVGELVTVPPFDWDKFEENVDVEISFALLDATQCDDELLKQNSLFITDLSVVEDWARIGKKVNNFASGNVEGVYSFGNLIRNICHTSQTGITRKEFLKRWLRRWTKTTVINGYTVAPRTFVYNALIAPWILNAGGYLGTPYNSVPSNPDEWEYYWDLCNEENLLNYAPFRLMAIVNRLDLRGNSAYGPAISNSGETRLIYTLVAPFELQFSNLLMHNTPAGMPPRTSDGIFGNGCDDLLDWQGMNVIFEFGNPQTTKCDVKDFAQAWADLSELTLGSTDYKDALEEILHVVIDSNSNPARSENNYSCINRIRTNERIFFDAGSCQPGSAAAWAGSDWELSQFEINADSGGYLLPTPVSNTPRNEHNRLFVSSVSFLNNGGDNGATTPEYINNWWDGDAGSKAVIDWLYGHSSQVLLGTHNMPASYTDNGNTYHLAATARMDLEAYHIWEMNWGVTTTNYSAIPVYSNDLNAKNIRRQFSLNTCQGCHGGENKTIFTHVRPLGWGESARYWLATPDHDTRHVDNPTSNTRHATNAGSNNINLDVNLDPITMPNYYIGDNDRHQRVSAMLTGVNYKGPGNWEDDFIDVDDDFRDTLFNDPNTLFYVADPTSRVDNYAYLGPYTHAGFNDLQHRKQVLCQLLSISCTLDTSESIILTIFSGINTLPYVE